MAQGTACTATARIRRGVVIEVVHLRLEIILVVVVVVMMIQMGRANASGHISTAPPCAVWRGTVNVHTGIGGQGY